MFNSHAELALVYTDYGYGHVDLAAHGKDLEVGSDMIDSIWSSLAGEESKSTKPVIPEKFDTLTFKEIKDLQPHMPAHQYAELERAYDRIIRVNFINGAIGGIRRRNISSKITLKVKTMHGKRKTHSIEVSIFDKVEVLMDKLLKLEQDEMVRYLSYKLLYCMGKVQTLDLSKVIWTLGLKNGSQILLVGNRNFQWDPLSKGQDIQVSVDALT